MSDHLSPPGEDLNATTSSFQSDPDIDSDRGFDGSSSNAGGGAAGGTASGPDDGEGMGDEDSLVKSTDMPDQMQQHAVAFAADAIKQAEEEGKDQHQHSNAAPAANS